MDMVSDPCCGEIGVEEVSTVQSATAVAVCDFRASTQLNCNMVAGQPSIAM